MRSYATIDASTLRVIESGMSESRTHVEQMAMDMSRLLVSSFPDLEEHANRMRGLSFLQRMREGGRILGEVYGPDAPAVVIGHPSDSVRGWGAFAVGLLPGISLARRLDLIRPFATDPHFAVREWAWLGVRSHVAGDVCEAIELLLPWLQDDLPYPRRFVVEATRPRSVWGAHCAVLKAQPWLGLPLLRPLFADRRRYVEDSVANWMNDARKSQPMWVEDVCRALLRDHGAAATRLYRRALRLPYR